MAFLLSREIAKLMDDARSGDEYEDDIIQKMTLVVGYAHMAQFQPEYWHSFYKHLQALRDLAWTHGQEHLSKILEMIAGGGFTGV